MKPSCNEPLLCPQSYVNSLYWESIHAERSGDLSAVGYPELGEGFNRTTYRMRLQALERLLKHAGAWPLGRLLEGGVGIGAYAPLWRKAGVGRWTGLDISFSAIEHVTTSYPAHEFYAADLCDRTALDSLLTNERFDLVTAVDILYHIVEDNKFADALVNLAGRVQPNGHLVVSDIFCSADYLAAAHIKRRSLVTYNKVLAPIGYQLVAREPVFAVLGHGVLRSPPRSLDLFLLTIWRAAGKFIRVTPIAARDFVGTVVANGLKPVDAILRSAGVTAGLNLELAIFRRVG